MVDKIKRIGYNRNSVSPDIARVLDTLLANLPDTSEPLSPLPTDATLSDVIIIINKIINKINK